MRSPQTIIFQLDMLHGCIFNLDFRIHKSAADI